MLRGLALGISIFRLCAVGGGGDEDCEWTLELSLKQDLGLDAEPEEQMYAITPAGKKRKNRIRVGRIQLYNNIIAAVYG